MRHFARRKKRVAWLFIALLLILGITAHGQAPVETTKPGNSTTNPRALNVTGLDEKEQPVTDLDSKDFQVYEDNKIQAIKDFYPPMPPRPGKAASATLILFDLLNTVFTQRENSTTQIVAALQPQEASDSVFLYVLSNRGEWYPVHALYTQTQGAAAGSADDAPWTRQIRPLLDQTIDKVHALRIEDYKDQGARSAATFLALNQIGDAFVKIPGPKSIVWLTRGAPNWVDYPYGCKDIPFPDGTGSYIGGKCTDTCTRRPGVAKCVDYTAFLASFGAKLARTDTVFSSVIINPQGALPPADRGRSRDTLQQLANVSGGQVYLKGEIEKAIEEALQGGRARYQLTYNAVAPDGKYHRVRVECSRKGVRIEAPQGYYAEEAKVN